MHLERPETWLHGVSVDRDVGVPDMPQLPPKHGRVPLRKSGLCERNRKGLTEGLETIKVDNHCALEGHLRDGSRSFEIRRPKCVEGSPKM